MTDHYGVVWYVCSDPT